MHISVCVEIPVIEKISVGFIGVITLTIMVYF